MPTFRKFCRLPVNRPFRLATVVRSHGWYDLEPFRFDGTASALSTTIESGNSIVDLTITQAAPSELAISVRSTRPIVRSDFAAVTRMVRRVLDLDAELNDLWRRTAEQPGLAWVAAHGAGRMLRAPTLFEDLMKILFTTNCSWSLTRAMCASMVAKLGRVGPSGNRAFPPAVRVADQNERFFRDSVKTGYRARAVRELAQRGAAGEFDGLEDEMRAGRVTEVKKTLASIRGFGPYATGLALRLLGVRSEMALDSFCRERLRQLWGRRKAPTDAAIEKAFRHFGDDRGLALWLTLTADWHDGVGDNDDGQATK